MPALGKLIVKVGADIAEYMSKMGALQSKMATTGARLQKIGGKMSSMGSKLTRNVTLPIVGIGVASFKTAADFQSSMTKIKTLVGVAGKQVDKWGKDILEMAPKLGRSPRELAEGLFFVTSAGFKGAEAMDILEVSAKAAAIGLGETKDIANAVTSVMTAYGEENITAARATDILAMAVREGKLEASELAPVIGRVLPLASELGISFEEVAANIATFSRLGISASESVVGLRGVMNTLIKPSKEAKEALKEIGMTSEDLRKKVGKDGLAKTLMFLLDATDGNVEALGDIIPNVRALTDVLATAGSQGEEYQQILKNIEDEHGIIKDGFEEVGDNAEQQWAKTKAAAEAALIKIGNELIPPVVKQMEKLTKSMAKMTPKQRKQAIQWGAIAIAAGPILKILGGITTALGKLLPIISKVAVFFTGPLGLAAALISAVVAGGLFFDKLPLWGKILLTIVLPFSAVIAKGKELFEKIQELGGLSGVWDKISSRWKGGTGKAKSVVTDIVSSIKEKFKSLVKAVSQFGKDLVKKFSESIFGKIFQAVAAIAELGKAINEFIGTWILIGLEWGVGIIGNFISGMAKKIAGLATTVGNWLMEHIGQPILNAVAAAVNWGIDVIGGFISGLAKEIAGLATTVGDWMIEHIGQPIIDAAASAFNWGADVMTQFIEGLKSRLAAATFVIRQLAERIRGATPGSGGERAGPSFQHGGEIPGSSGQAVPILAHAREIMFPENVSSFLKRVGIPIVSSQAGQAGTMKIEVGVNDSKFAEVIKIIVDGKLIDTTTRAQLLALAGG